MPKTKRRASPAEAVSCYIIQIVDWDWSYSFGINDPRYDDRPYSDYRHLVVRAKLLLPSKLKSKAQTAELTFMPDVQHHPPIKEHDQRPLGVGYIDLRDVGIIGGFSMAADALGPVMQMLVAGRFKYIVLDGEPLRYRKARIRHFRFETRIELDEYPDE
ncbi:hypothetical protein ACWAT4_37155 [Bradyrhizobium manausense]